MQQEFSLKLFLAVDQSTPLHYAAVSSKCFEILTLLLADIKEHYEDALLYVNAKDGDGDTPLMWATRSTHPANLNLLICVGSVFIIM